MPNIDATKWDVTVLVLLNYKWNSVVIGWEAVFKSHIYPNDAPRDYLKDVVRRVGVMIQLKQLRQISNWCNDKAPAYSRREPI